MLIMSAELSGEAKLKNTPTRTEGESQGQSIGDEIILPRGRAYSMSRKDMPIPGRKTGMQDKKLAGTFESLTSSMVLSLLPVTTLKESNSVTPKPGC